MSPEVATKLLDDDGLTSRLGAFCTPGLLSAYAERPHIVAA
jgi:hypothetical protein